MAAGWMESRAAVRHRFERLPKPLQWATAIAVAQAITQLVPWAALAAIALTILGVIVDAPASAMISVLVVALIAIVSQSLIEFEYARKGAALLLKQNE